jgi:endonuclease YncB( thermonuclease family)
MIRYVFYVFALVTFKVVFPARPQSPPVLVGTVIKIVDGDTIDVELTSGPIGVRLHGIDTPERGQPWAKESTSCFGCRQGSRNRTVRARSLRPNDWHHLPR